MGVANKGRWFTGVLGAAQAGVVFRGGFSPSKSEKRSPFPKPEESSSSGARLSPGATEPRLNDVAYQLRPRRFRGGMGSSLEGSSPPKPEEGPSSEAGFHGVAYPLRFRGGMGPSLLVSRSPPPPPAARRAVVFAG